MTKEESIIDVITRKSENAFKSYLDSKTPKARIKRAEEKLALMEKQKKAELLEAKLREKEIAYKKAHPKWLGIFYLQVFKKPVRFLKTYKSFEKS